MKYQLQILFNDNTWKTVDFEPFLFAYDRGYYNKYRDIRIFKKFKIDQGELVWGKDWDLIFPVSDLHKGKLKFPKTQPDNNYVSNVIEMAQSF